MQAEENQTDPDDTRPHAHRASHRQQTRRLPRVQRVPAKVHQSSGHRPLRIFSFAQWHPRSQSLSTGRATNQRHQPSLRSAEHCRPTSSSQLTEKESWIRSDLRAKLHRRITLPCQLFNLLCNV